MAAVETMQSGMDEFYKWITDLLNRLGVQEEAFYNKTKTHVSCVVQYNSCHYKICWLLTTTSLKQVLNDLFDKKIGDVVYYIIFVNSIKRVEIINEISQNYVIVEKRVIATNVVGHVTTRHMKVVYMTKEQAINDLDNCVSEQGARPQLKQIFKNDPLAVWLLMRPGQVFKCEYNIMHIAHEYYQVVDNSLN